MFIELIRKENTMNKGEQQDLRLKVASLTGATTVVFLTLMLGMRLIDEITDVSFRANIYTAVFAVMVACGTVTYLLQLPDRNHPAVFPRDFERKP